MISSMTAFARQEQQSQWGSFIWEVRSVNHRYLDISLRLPEEFRVLEPRVRDLISQSLARGKVECTLRFQPSSQVDTDIPINEDLCQQVLSVCKKLNSMLDAPAPISALEVLKWPGVLQTMELDLDQVRKQAMSLLERTLMDILDVRQREGAKLKELIEQRCHAMQLIVDDARTQVPQIIASRREKLLERLAELKSEIDQSRVEQEMVLMAQKMDVTEEIDRLEAHIAEVRHILEQDKPIGRRLDFLMQELNREANTLGSKSADIQTTRASVDLKVFIEQMREQVQNIE
jgi:uncharacterized protein (TIGR00255 family)